MEFRVTIHLHEYLRLLDPEQFQQSFLSWVKSISNVTQGEVIAIDGKTLRHSYDNAQDKGAIAFGKRLGNG